MSKPKPSVLLFRDDYDRVRTWVLSYPNRETGGQLFGLWTHDRKPYINIITGPGKNCRHGTHSFHQDIDYLKNVGTFLNSQFMMCHIGEWHSHHRLRLRQPSSGDLNSIWKHFPAGLEHFLLIIATIEEGDEVRLNPWLFTASTHLHELVDVEIINKDNVFMRDEIVVKNIRYGEEVDVVQNPPLDFHSTAKNPEYKPVRTSEKSKIDQEWWQKDCGNMFVQLLHSKLENIIDESTSIDKSLGKEQGCLMLTFQRNTCRVVLTFPRGFGPNEALAFVCHVPGSSQPLEWYEFMETGWENTEEFIDNHIVDVLKRAVPHVYKTTVL